MFKIFIKEFKNLFQSKWRIFSYVLLLLIPMIYSSIVISSFFKPFHNAHNLKVVVVDLDKRPESIKLTNYLGEKSGAKLGKKFLKYNIEDASKIYKTQDQVDQAVRNGDIAAAIVIPKGYTKAIVKLGTEVTDKLFEKFDPSTIRQAILDIFHPKRAPPGQGREDFRVKFMNGYKYNFIKGQMTNLASAIAEFHKHVMAPTITGTNLFAQLSADTKSELVHQEILGSNINSYGKGFSPFFVSISLWAGALAATFVIKNKRYYKGHKGTFSTYVGKMLVWQFTSFIQSSLLALAITLLGVLPATGWSSAWQLWLYIVFMSAMFSLMMQALGSMFRYADIGKFIGVIILIIDLVASSGSFPSFMLPKLFEFISTYIPFTYSINGMRETLWEPSAIDILTQMGYLFIFPVILTPLALILNFIHDRKTKKKTGEYDSYEITTGDL